MNVPTYYALQQCDKVTIENTTMPYIKSLYSCLNRVVGDGYTDRFIPVETGFKSEKGKRVYRHDEVNIINVFSFEGNANIDENATMYIIETKDGIKGTCISSINQYNTGSLYRFQSEQLS
jgi:hypothetical protein